MTIGVIKALHRLRLERTVALVGFDDFLLADVLAPGITVVLQDTVALGRTAAQRLFVRLEGNDSPAHTFVVPTRLIERGSGEIRPASTDSRHRR